MKMKIIKLNLPKNNKFSITEPIIYSDTLFSAIVNCYVKLYGDENIKEFIEKLNISSVFMGLETEKENVYILPKPYIQPNFLKKENIEREQIKEWKKVKYLSKSIFESLINNREFEYEKWSGIAFTKEEYNQLIESSKKEEKEFEKLNFIVKYTETKNALNRYTGASEYLFEKDVLEFQQIEGIKPFLYFFIENLDTEIEASIKLMVDEGLGAERSTGKGFLDRSEKKDLDLENNKNNWINLSLVMPKDMEEVQKVDTYSFITRGGYVFFGYGTGWRKKRVRMFNIGSTFKEKIEGTNIENNIKLDGIKGKTVYHYGKAFLIGGDING